MKTHASKPPAGALPLARERHTHARKRRRTHAERPELPPEHRWLAGPERADAQHALVYSLAERPEYLPTGLDDQAIGTILSDVASTIIAVLSAARGQDARLLDLLLLTAINSELAGICRAGTLSPQSLRAVEAEIEESRRLGAEIDQFMQSLDGMGPEE